MYERLFKLSFTSKKSVFTSCDYTVIRNIMDLKNACVCFFSFSTSNQKSWVMQLYHYLCADPLFLNRKCFSTCPTRKVPQARIVPRPYKIPALHQKESFCCLLSSCATSFPVHRVLNCRHFLLDLSLLQVR